MFSLGDKTAVHFAPNLYALCVLNLIFLSRLTNSSLLSTLLFLLHQYYVCDRVIYNPNYMLFDI